MTTLLTFDQARCRKANPAQSASKSQAASAKILMFTGIRRERLYVDGRIPEPVRHAPMFEEPVPEKPTRRKRRRGKTS